VKQIPVKADIEAQETFKTEGLEPLVEQAQAGKIALFFVDAAHFVMLPFLGYLHSLTVRFIKAASGRQRFSVLGALNAITKEVVTITDHGYINALSVCELFQKLHGSVTTFTDCCHNGQRSVSTLCARGRKSAEAGNSDYFPTAIFSKLKFD